MIVFSNQYRVYFIFSSFESWAQDEHLWLSYVRRHRMSTVYLVNIVPRVPQRTLIFISFILQQQNQMNGTGPRSTVGKVSGCRRLLTAKSSALSSSPDRPNTWVEIVDHGLIPMVCLPLQLNQERLLSFTSESICTKYWLITLSSLSMKKCGKVNWPFLHDHSCWLGHKATHQAGKSSKWYSQTTVIGWFKW